MNLDDQIMREAREQYRRLAEKIKAELVAEIQAIQVKVSGQPDASLGSIECPEWLEAEFTRRMSKK